VGAYGERQALNIGVSGAGNNPFFKDLTVVIGQVHNYYSFMQKWVS